MAGALSTGLTAGVSVDVCDCTGDLCDCSNSYFENFPLDIPKSAIVWNFNNNQLTEFSTTELDVGTIVELYLGYGSISDML